MCKRLAEWLLKKVKIAKEDVDVALSRCDADKDGFYSLGEIVQAIIYIVGKKGQK